MGVRYFFDQIGRDGSTMGSRINGAPYTVEQALAWALDDVRSGSGQPARHESTS